jgi:hypothetical protein
MVTPAVRLPAGHRPLYSWNMTNHSHNISGMLVYSYLTTVVESMTAADILRMRMQCSACPSPLVALWKVP